MRAKGRCRRASRTTSRGRSNASRPTALPHRSVCAKRRTRRPIVAQLQGGQKAVGGVAQPSKSAPATPLTSPHGALPQTSSSDALRPNGEGPGVVAPNPSFVTHQPACKPGSVGHRRLTPTMRDGHSSGIALARDLEQPTRTASLTSPLRTLSLAANCPHAPSLFGLAPGGVCRAGSVAGPAVRSYRTFSPLLAISTCAATTGGSFSVALSLGLPPPDVIRHRMSMEPGLSSPSGLSARAGAAVRPTDVSLMGAKGHQVNPRWSRKIRQK
jgi:hypothetical protein